ncbi:MAG: acyl carrier protein [Firmicutes bacterium]|jgi:acyl carrier protein|nr:acyl carrier protein [Bacillota bacterium]
MILDKVIAIIAEQLGIDEEEITSETNLLKDLEADSLDAVEIIMAMEDEFDMEIPDEDAEQLTCVSDIVRYIEDHAK